MSYTLSLDVSHEALHMLRVTSICIQMISQALLLNAGEEEVFTVVYPGSGKVQGGLSSSILQAALRDVFIGLSCLLFACRGSQSSPCFPPPIAGARQNMMPSTGLSNRPNCSWAGGFLLADLHD